jgi:hypothetical protein
VISIGDSSYAAKGAVQFSTNALTSGITVAAGVASVNSGTGPMQIVKLDGTSKLPAVDGSALTNLNAGNIASGTLPVARGGTNATTFANNAAVISSGTGAALTSLNCTLNQVLAFDVTGAAVCRDLSAISSGFVNGGNSFGANATLGTNDNFTLGFKTNNTTKMTIDAAGLVGIGTTAPTSLLTLAKNGEDGLEITTADAGANMNPIIFANRSRGTVASPTAVASGDSLMEILATGHDGSAFKWEGRIEFKVDGAVSVGNLPTALLFGTGSNQGAPVERMRISSSGNVGIGTASPAYPLDVNGDIRTQGTGVGLILANGTTDKWEWVVPAADSSLRLWDFNSSLDRLVINSSGNIGIGTAAPGAKLEVAGQVKITGGTPGAGKVLTSDAVGLASWVTPSASGITSLGGQTGATQTFAIGTAGTAPAFSSATDTHTLNIPMASTAAVTAGLISKADYDVFNAKLGTTLTSTNIFVGNGSNVATGVAMSGDATLANTGALTLNTVAVGKGGTGATSFAANSVIISNGTGTALQALTTCTLNQVLAFDASGYAVCQNVGSIYSGFVNGGNSFAVNATLGTNDNFTLGFKTNNTTKVTIDSSGKTGVGTVAPDSRLTTSSNAAALPAPGAFMTGTELHIGGVDGSKTRILVDSFGSAVGSRISLRSADGTAAVPSATLSGEVVGALNAVGYGASQYTDALAGVGFIATENYTNTANGMAVSLGTVSNGSTSAVERMRIDQNGYVGIGTISPTHSLHVASQAVDSTLELESATNTVNGATIDLVSSRGTLASKAIVQNGDELMDLAMIAYDGSTNRYGARIFGIVDGVPGANDIPTRLEFHTRKAAASNAAVNMVIKGDGKVGIGTTAPAAKLHVADSSADTTVDNTLGVRIANTDLTNNNYANIKFATNDTGAGTFPAGIIGTQFTSHALGAISGDLYFITASSGTTNEHMRIAANGNVGIGTSTPARKVEISEANTVDGDILKLTNTAPASNKGSWILFDPTAGGASYEKWEVGSDGAGFAIWDTNDAVRRIAVANDGKVGIGLITPAAKLDVAGNVKLGTDGTAFTSTGACTIASTAITNTAATYTCTGVPATTAVAVWCSGSAAMTDPNTSALYCRANGTLNQVICNTTVANSVAMTWNCMWMKL